MASHSCCKEAGIKLQSGGLIYNVSVMGYYVVHLEIKEKIKQHNQNTNSCMLLPLLLFVYCFVLKYKLHD